MPFIPDSHNFVVTLTREGDARRFDDQTIELLYLPEPSSPELRVKRVRRTNTAEVVDEKYWTLGKAQHFSKSNESLFVVPLTFQGAEFSCELEERSKSCEKTARLLQLFGVGGRIHLEIAVNAKRYTNLFLNLNYRVPVRRGPEKGS